MKAEELRIGNWIDYKGVNVQWSIEDYAEWGNNIEQLVKPIQLDEHWLERMGFDKSEKKWKGNGQDYQPEYPETRQAIYDINQFQVVLEDWEWKKGKIDKNTLIYFQGEEIVIEEKQITYLHQLQNLHYSLTGSELEIKEYEHMQ